MYHMLKWTIIFLVVVCATIGIAAGISIMHSSEIVFKTPDTKLTVIYPCGTPDGSLSPGDLQSIKARLVPHVNTYTSVTLYINCYPERQNLSGAEQRNFQIVLVGKQGGVYESRRIYTSADNLTRTIQEKLSKGINAVTSSQHEASGSFKTTF